MGSIASPFYLPTLLLNDEPAGTLARTLLRHSVNSGTLAAFNTSGQVAVNAIPLPGGLTVTNIQVLIGTTGATGPTHFWLGLSDANLNMLAVSADNLTAAQTASTPVKLAMTVPYVIPLTGLYYVLASSSASTTAPTASGMTVVAGVPSMVPVMSGTAGTQATPPALGAQLNSGTVSSGGTGNFAAWIS